jgi:site-specific DNA recombinase
LRVKARQQQQTHTIGERVREGLSQSDANRTGRGPKYLFSGLLKCGKCGANFVICNAQSYACGNRVNGGPCDSEVLIQRRVIEAGLLAGIARDVLSPEVEAEVCRRAAKLARGRPVSSDRSQELGRLRAEVANLTDAIATGALRSSPALAARMQSAERELARLEAEVSAPPRGSVVEMIPRLAGEYRSMVADLANTLTGVSVPRARAEVRKLVGEIRVEETEDAVELWKTQTAEQALVRLAGGSQQICLVAGVGFEPTTFGL